MYPKIRNVLFVTLLVLFLQGTLSIPIVLAKKPSFLSEYGISILNSFLFITASLYGLYRSKLKFSDSLRIPSISVQSLVGLFLLVLPLHILSALVAYLSITSVPMVRQINESAAGVLPGNFSSIFLLLGVVAPVTEEIYFRGFVFRGLLKTKSYMFSIIFSSVLFALIHVNPVQMFGALLGGFLFAFAFHVTKNILVPILLHALLNTFALFLPFLIIYFDIQNSLPSFKFSWYTLDIIDLAGILSLGIAALLLRSPEALRDRDRIKNAPVADR